MIIDRHEGPTKNARSYYTAQPVSAIPSRNGLREPEPPTTTSHPGKIITKANSTGAPPVTASHVAATTIKTLTHHTTVGSRAVKWNDPLNEKHQQLIYSTSEHAGITRDVPHFRPQYEDNVRRIALNDVVHTQSSTTGHSMVKHRKNGLHAPVHAGRGMPMAMTEKPNSVQNCP